MIRVMEAARRAACTLPAVRRRLGTAASSKSVTPLCFLAPSLAFALSTSEAREASAGQLVRNIFLRKGIN
jgi:hypothetical protein